MKIYNNLNIPKKYKRSSLAIGNFDGIHIGHQKVFKYAKIFSKKNKSKFGILTFSPLPVMFFNKKIKNYRLSLETEKFELLKKYGVDFVINIKFNKKFSKISAKNFVEKIIFKKINPKYVFVSNNFKFGNKRKGNINLLKKFSKKYDYKLLQINPYKHKTKLVSSTRIRKCLKKGNIKLANKLSELQIFPLFLMKFSKLDYKFAVFFPPKFVLRKSIHFSKWFPRTSVKVPHSSTMGEVAYLKQFRFHTETRQD